MVANQPKRVFSAAGAGTQNSTIWRTTPGEYFSVQVQHPAATTTAYQLHGSNTPPDFRGDAPDYTSAVFNDQDVRDRDNVAIGAKAAAVNFTIEMIATCTLYRLNLVTTVGSGTIIVDLARGSA